MKTMSNGTKKALKTINSILWIFAVAAMLHNLMHFRNIFFCVTRTLTLLVLVFVAFYVVSGYKKDAAKYYKMAFAFYAVTQLLWCILLGQRGFGIFVGAMVVSCVLSAVLAFAKDLGRKNSVILGSLLFTDFLALLIYRFIAQGFTTELIFGDLTNLVIAIILNLIILAKYEDKAERGTL